MDEIFKEGSFKTKKEAVSEGLKLLLNRLHQRKIRSYKGKLTWSGNLDSMRTDV